MNRRDQIERLLTLAGAVTGMAVGTASGLALERYGVGHLLGGSDPYAQEPFGALHGTPRVVVADDGVELHVEIDEPRWPPETRLTVIFSHGYALNLDSWHFQRRDLVGIGRLVFWDQRSHGRSGRGPAQSATMGQLGSDLGRVVDAVAPTGPVVLVGHSMGGMTIMALAEQRPELFRSRVTGVGLLATSASDLSQATLGVRGPLGRLAHRLAPVLVYALARQPELIDRSRREGSDLGYVLTRRYAFASQAPPSLVEFTADMLAGTPIDVIAEFLPIFDTHDKRAALSALHDLETLVFGAGKDFFTPIEHSREIARFLPKAQYVEAADTGHMAILERHEVITRLLSDLIRRVARRSAIPRQAGAKRRTPEILK